MTSQKGSLFIYLIGPIALMVFSFAAVTLMAFNVLQGQKSDGLVINLAGRQRMLSQKYTKEVFIEMKTPGMATSESLPRTQQMAVTRRLFEATLVALDDGGGTFKDLAASEPVSTPATKDADIKKLLKEVKTKWAALTEQSEAMIAKTQAGQTASAAEIDQLKTTSLAVLATMNKAVVAYQALSEGRVSRLNNIMLMGLVLIVICAGVAYIVVRNRVLEPLKQAIDLAEAVSSGDLRRRVNNQRHDEVGQLCQALNTMCDNLNQIVNRIKQHSDQLNDNAGGMSAFSDQLNSEAHGLIQKAETLGAFSGEITSTTETVRAGFSESIHSISTVAASTEEMSVTAATIAENAGIVQRASEGAVDSVRSAVNRVDQLRDSARQVDRVVEVIVDFSEQTKLLALNATIEAARAGNYGKGFAVVAEEVKLLAQQTNQAINEIRGKIEGIKGATEHTVSEIGSISTVINEVNGLIAAIVNSVQEQKIATQGISQTVADVSNGFRDVHASVAQLADGQTRLNRDVSGVNNSGQELAAAVNQVRDRSGQLLDLSQELKGIVKQFEVA